jgi:hypothetical protein
MALKLETLRVTLQQTPRGRKGSPAAKEREKAQHNFDKQHARVKRAQKMWIKKVQAVDVPLEAPLPTDRDDLNRRANLAVGGGVMPAVMWSESSNATGGFKNVSLTKLCSYLYNPEVLLYTVVYADVGAINDALFKWLRPATDSNLPKGIRRVQLVTDLNALFQLYDGLAACDAFVMFVHARFDCVRGLGVTIPPEKIRTAVGQIAERMKSELKHQTEFLMQPPTCIAAVAGPAVSCYSLRHHLKDTYGEGARVLLRDPLFRENPLFRRKDVQVCSEAQNKQRVTEMLAAVVGSESSESSHSDKQSYWKTPIAQRFFGRESELRPLLEAYAADQQSKIKDITPVWDLLVQWFIDPELTTQEVEGLHGYLNAIAGSKPAMTIEALSRELSLKVNGVMGRAAYVFWVLNRRSELNTFQEQTGDRHRVTSQFFTYWTQPEVSGINEAVPEVNAKTSQLWRGCDDDNFSSPADKLFDELVDKLVPKQRWLARRSPTSTVTWHNELCNTNKWEHIFRLQPQSEDKRTRSVEWEFQCVNSESPDMSLRPATSFADRERFLGYCPFDLLCLDVLPVDVTVSSTGQLTFGSDFAHVSLLEYIVERRLKVEDGYAPGATGAGETAAGETAAGDTATGETEAAELGRAGKSGKKVAAGDTRDAATGADKASQATTLVNAPLSTLAWAICGTYSSKYPMSMYKELRGRTHFVLAHIWQTGVSCLRVNCA